MPDQQRAFSVAMTSYLVKEPKPLPEIKVTLDQGFKSAIMSPVEFTADNKADFVTAVANIANQLWEALDAGLPAR